jgi:hypothetical protein
MKYTTNSEIRAAFYLADVSREKWRMFVAGVTRAGKPLLTSLFKGVGTLGDAEPRKERNSTRPAQQWHKLSYRRWWGGNWLRSPWELT